MNTVIILLIMLIVVVPPAVVIAFVGYGTIKALGRNPSSASKILFGTIIILAFVWTLSVIAMFMIFQWFGAK